MRLLSTSMRRKAVRYQAASRSWASASDVCASITDSGVRSSWDASAVNSICRCLACSIGVPTRRPMLSAPRNTMASRMGPTISSASTTVDRAWPTLSVVCPTTT